MTTEKIPCWECEEGLLERVFEDFETMTKDGSVVIPNTPLLKCPKCGDSVFDTDATEHIEKHLPPYLCRSSRRKEHQYNNHMTESPTPKTDALREVIIGQYKEDELTGNGMGNLLAALTDIETLERERDVERALADRLAKSIMNWKSEQWRGTPEKATEQVMSALAAWKEARSE